MKVLDIGCGAGCAALVLAELVGESGSVIGIDRAPAAVASAAERARKLDKRNISFCGAEVNDIKNETFDAVAGATSFCSISTAPKWSERRDG